MKENYLMGVSFKLLNCLLFPVLSLLMLKTVSTVPMMQIFFYQVFLGSLISLVYLWVIKQNIPLILAKGDFTLYFLRALTNLCAMYLWMYALTTLGINEATALGYTGPLWVFLMARYFLGERFKIGILSLIIINLIGMLIILQPRYMDIEFKGAAASFGAIILWSIYEIICKKQASTQHYMLQSFYFMIISAIIVFPFAFYSWKEVSINEVYMLSLVAFISVANITVVFIAYSLAPITLLAPFSYSRLIFTVILTAYLYNTVPSMNTFIGAAIIITGNLYFTYKIKNNQLA